MTGLKCNVTSCANNEQYQCCLPDIQVAGLDAKECCETCCASFENKSAAKNNAIRHDVPNHALQVNCNVFTCVHYSDGLCEADSICVDRIKKQKIKIRHYAKRFVKEIAAALYKYV